MKNKKTNIFREESLENVSAPEQLTDYLRIANPSSWLVLFALILLFGGLVVWSSIGQLETVAGGTAVVSESTGESGGPSNDAVGVHIFVLFAS